MFREKSNRWLPVGCRQRKKESKKKREREEGRGSEKHRGRTGRKKGQNDAGTREVEWWIARRGNESEASDRRYTYQQCGAPVLRGPPRLSANTFLRVPSKLCASTIADYFLLSWFRLVITANLSKYHVPRSEQFCYSEIAGSEVIIIFRYNLLVLVVCSKKRGSLSNLIALWLWMFILYNNFETSSWENFDFRNSKNRVMDDCGNLW